MTVKINKSFYDKCEKGMKAMGEVVKEEMKYRAPKDTWEMANSIDTKTVREGNEIITTTRTNLGEDSYPSIIEYGSIYIGVGGADAPVEVWEAYRKRGFSPPGQTMPFCRVADFTTTDIRVWAFKEAFK